MATKLGPMSIYLKGLLPTKSHDLLIAWSRGKLKTWHLYYHSAYDNQN